MPNVQMPTDIRDTDDTHVKLLVREETRVTEEIDRLTAYLKSIRDELFQEFNGHEALRCDGAIYTNGYVNRWKERQIQDAYPDLASQFTRTIEQFDIRRFVAAFPDAAKEYQSRQWRRVGR